MRTHDTEKREREREVPVWTSGEMTQFSGRATASRRKACGRRGSSESSVGEPKGNEQNKER